MPEEEKIKSSEKQVDLDTSGPEVDVVLEESKEEVVDHRTQQAHTNLPFPIPSAARGPYVSAVLRCPQDFRHVGADGRVRLVSCNLLRHLYVCLDQIEFVSIHRCSLRAGSLIMRSHRRLSCRGTCEQTQCGVWEAKFFDFLICLAYYPLA